jgi:putative sterol carrier protein
MATLDEITERIRRAAETETPMTHSVKLDLKGDGFIHVDGRAVSNTDAPADLVVAITKADLEALGRRELDPMRAIMTGRMKLSDMVLALKLQPAIQSLFSKAV